MREPVTEAAGATRGGACLVLAALLGLSTPAACAPARYVRVPGPVGPPPAGQGPDAAARREGHLVVHTDIEAVDRGGSYYYPHGSYAIHDLEGRRVRRVANRSDVEDETPDRVSLAPGTYVVRARGLGRFLEIVVRVEPDRTTTVHLDGSFEPPEGGSPEAVVVTVDGEPIGWRSAPLE